MMNDKQPYEDLRAEMFPAVGTITFNDGITPPNNNALFATIDEFIGVNKTSIASAMITKTNVK